MSEVDPIVVAHIHRRYCGSRRADDVLYDSDEVTEIIAFVRADQDAISTARERKACMADVCSGCAQGCEVKKVGGATYRHDSRIAGNFPCNASMIRDRTAKESAK